MAPHTKAALLLAAVALAQPTALTGFSVPPAAGPSDAAVCGRRAAFVKTAGFLAGAVLSGPTSALAKEADPALKGTKADPKYQACMSQCVYDCTKPKGDEQKSRSECIPECKQKCATSKEQLMLGTPKKD